MDNTTILSTLSRPFWWSSEVAASLSSPTNSYTEKTKRVFQVVTVVLLSPMSLLLKGVAELPLLFNAKPYVYKKGNGSPSSNDIGLTILNWNICGLPGGLPSWFGGTAPLPKRVDGIAKFILEEDCDIVCLQEAHDNYTNQILYEKLRDHYCHFYLNIGSKSFSHNSGLLVASKKELSNISFTPFQYSGKQFGINKGFFSFKVANGKQPPLEIVTTHLQPYTTKKDQDIRANALKDIIKSGPDVICGDLNIDRFKPEEGSTIIEGETVDSLGSEETATDRLMPGHTDQDNFSIDYSLLKNQNYTIHTELRNAYDLNAPEEALSDHHALRSTVH